MERSMPVTPAITAARKVADKLTAKGWGVSAVQLSRRPDLVEAFMRAQITAEALAQAIEAVRIED
jgi:hypothetical protein